MEHTQKPRVRKRGLKRVFGLIVAGLLVIFVTLGLVVDAVVSAVHRPFRGRRNTILVVLLFALLAAGIVYGWRWYGTMDNGDLHQTVTTTMDYPSESTVELDDFTTAGNMPQSIAFSSIGAEGAIQPVALDQDHKISQPNNVHVAGWYTGSAKPGEQGLSIINGHVQGKFSKGLFYDMHKLKPADRFTVTYGDSRTVDFEVVSIQTVSIRDADATLAKKDPDIQKQLNLIAITNANDKGTSASNERVIVVAKAK